MTKTLSGVRDSNNINTQIKAQKVLQVHEVKIRNNNYENAFVVNDTGDLLAKRGKNIKLA